MRTHNDVQWYHRRLVPQWFVFSAWSLFYGRLIVHPAMLYMLEIIQLTAYIKHFWKRDKSLLKFLVLLCFTIDTICTIAIFSWVVMVCYQLSNQTHADALF